MAFADKVNSAPPTRKKFSETEGIRHFFGPRHGIRPSTKELEGDNSPIFYEQKEEQHSFASISTMR